MKYVTLSTSNSHIYLLKPLSLVLCSLFPVYFLKHFISSWIRESSSKLKTINLYMSFSPQMSVRKWTFYIHSFLISLWHMLSSLNSKIHPQSHFSHKLIYIFPIQILISIPPNPNPILMLRTVKKLRVLSHHMLHKRWKSKVGKGKKSFTPYKHGQCLPI